ncbi:MAG: hypothetical protein JXB23_16080 [Candidatus Aminicenantes bacterium]|nr:hypothetical protein [Candidatus Aminicenantes bacterium]
MGSKTGYRIALVGTDSLQGKEIRNVLNEGKMPLEDMGFYDPVVEEEFSMLTRFRGEPKIVHHLDEASLLPYELVFLASTPDVNRKFGKYAADNNIWAIDLIQTSPRDKGLPVLVAGVSDAAALKPKPRLIASPHPVTVILSHLFHLLSAHVGLSEGVAFVLQPVSAFDHSGVEELANQCYDVLQGKSIKKDVFKAQIAFNLLSHAGSSSGKGFSLIEDRIVNEVKRVLDAPKLPLSLAVIQAPVFFTYSLMIRFKLNEKISIAALESLFKTSSYFEYTSSKRARSISSVSVTGKDKIHIGRIKEDSSLPNSFWIWAVADNLTRGSALNAYEIAEEVLSSASRKK